jgi:hypothetical protein
MNKDKRIAAYILTVMIFAFSILSYLDTQNAEAKKFEHKYVAGDCIGFDLYDWDFERNSEGEELAQARIEYVRYDKYGAYYGLKLIDDKWENDSRGYHMNYPKFKYLKSKKPIGLMWASEVDNTRIVHAFSYTDYIPGSKIITIRNGITCRHGWKD